MIPGAQIQVAVPSQGLRQFLLYWVLIRHDRYRLWFVRKLKIHRYSSQGRDNAVIDSY